MSRRSRGRAAARIEVHAAESAGSLCLECGLCCDGTVFSYMTVQADEQEYVESLGLSTIADGDRFLSPQPCPAFQDSCCSLYTVGRPMACGAYECGLLWGLRNEERSRDECVAVILLVRAVARELEDLMEIAPGSFHRRAVATYIAEHSPQDDPDTNADFLLAFHRLADLGMQHFGYPIEPEEERALAAAEAIIDAPA
jgi:hypothetical protein